MFMQVFSVILGHACNAVQKAEKGSIRHLCVWRSCYVC